MIITRGGVPADFKSFFMSRWAARESFRRWIRMARTKPRWSTARQEPSFAHDRDKGLVQVPFVAASGSALADPIGERLAKLPSSLTLGVMGRKRKSNRKYPPTHR